MLLFPTKPRPQPGRAARGHSERTVTPQVMAKRLQRYSHSALGSPESDRVRRLVAAQAWTDAALALVETELPQWSLRRLTHDDGQWHCTLGRHHGLPEWLDDTVEGSHDVLPLAILEAISEAMRTDFVANAQRPPIKRLLAPITGNALCCDDFA